ncbi:hypothetical protein EV421DRAFT_1745720 [Armillaria borealis]|uniref:Uncharacterized protein n=1 Tax=Armillaria borealis TaxID=47425 RepID=A0AA39IEU9_9AGAR|nr:hypothetical protein EV421DRAFT_1745720 [Armillaria borealis]
MPMSTRELAVLVLLSELLFHVPQNLVKGFVEIVLQMVNRGGTYQSDLLSEGSKEIIIDSVMYERDRWQKLFPLVNISDFRTPDHTPVSAYRPPLLTAVCSPLLGRLNAHKYTWFERVHSLALAPGQHPEHTNFLQLSVRPLILYRRLYMCAYISLPQTYLGLTPNLGREEDLGKQEESWLMETSQLDLPTVTDVQGTKEQTPSPVWRTCRIII